jgi:hypothetical protein
MMAVEHDAPNIPHPDPSVLTAAMIATSRSDLRDEFKALVASLRETVTARIDAIDVADRLLAENVNRVPTLLDREIATLRNLFDAKHTGLGGVMSEKFEAVTARFTEIADRSKSDGETAKLAIKDALQAAKEAAAATQLSNADAIGKSEDAVKGTLESLDRRIGDAKQALDTGLSDLKNRVVSLETVALARRESRSDTHSNLGLLLTVVGAAGVGFGIFFGFAGLRSQQAPLPALITYASPTLLPGTRAP